MLLLKCECHGNSDATGGTAAARKGIRRTLNRAELEFAECTSSSQHSSNVKTRELECTREARGPRANLSSSSVTVLSEHWHAQKQWAGPRSIENRDEASRVPRRPGLSSHGHGALSSPRPGPPRPGLGRASPAGGGGGGRAPHGPAQCPEGSGPLATSDGPTRQRDFTRRLAWLPRRRLGPPPERDFPGGAAAPRARPASEPSSSKSCEKRLILPNVAYFVVFAKSPPVCFFGGPFLVPGHDVSTGILGKARPRVRFSGGSMPVRGLRRTCQVVAVTIPPTRHNPTLVLSGLI
jgi:hypothetical protein